ncbi:hypothetical protein O6H91_07G046700 [Diphasiastrum complanatum]|uniref:Uncharacterized protein n=1 Tax=Diphasiastrum complanatum TaxID=34168 RepID=A0ACC2D4R8_DIPCM|nr:hypothetical protein O6H91_07G046700 [Diphasiastrum complanatum]
MTKCKPSITPCEAGKKLSHIDDSAHVDATLFRQLVGSLIYLTTTRPDIYYAISLISQFMSSPTMDHWKAAKRILRYVKGTPNLGLIYKRQSVLPKLQGYVDADWAGSIDDRKSTTGYAFNFGSGCFSWSSNKQDTISLSSTEAEYKALSSATQEAVWLRKLLCEIGMKHVNPIVIFCDSQSGIQLAKNPIFHARTKHIEVKYHFVREKLQSEDISIVHCSTLLQVADIYLQKL